MRLSTDKDFANALLIASTIRERIASGALAPHAKLPVRQELCLEFNAALATMQRAIDILVEEGFISCTPGKGTFVHPHPPSQTEIALVFGRAISNRSLFGKALRTVAGEVGTKHGFRLRFFDFHSDRSEDSVVTLARLVRERRLAGIIVISPTGDALNQLPAEAAIPIVLVGEEGRSFPQHPRVEVDQSGFITEAMAILHAQGRHRIAHILADGQHGQLDDTVERLRILGCENTPYLVQFVGEGQRWRGAEHIAHLLMRLPRSERPNGLIIHDDNLMHWAGLGLRASGISIPDELSVIAHANLPSHQPCAVPLARLGFDVHEVLAAAMQLVAAPGSAASGPVLVPVRPDSFVG